MVHLVKAIMSETALAFFLLLVPSTTQSHKGNKTQWTEKNILHECVVIHRDFIMVYLFVQP